uniref:UTP-monosaccharide-1-phosphate uridylyltransferase n=1 Tax=Nephromyces sp. MMRI TaxID=2496275 RepID=A0A3Q8UBR8_9APIC|nr:UDP-glucose pyrophosphorylase [Nephromyces sp. MMRI]AZL94441.1 UDP-glucose pyrophosphorylase [Nephromyces sp. MMRI]
MAVSRAVAAYQPEVDGGLSSLYKSVLKRLELAEVSGELKEVIDDSQRQLLNALCEELEQGHLFEDLSASSVLSLLNQIRKFENDYPGGIFSYLRTARRLLSSFLGGESLDSEATSVTIPDCVRAYLEHPDYVKYEEIGLPGLTRCAFVLVAGGLGERLGYPGIKIGIPVEITTETTYIEHFISFILEYQRLGNERTSSHEANDSTSLRSQKLPMKLPLLIMTSEDTHYETAKLLEEKNYFGMDSDQIILAKQEKVPAFCDTQARLCIDPKDSSILMKPHGHGDVHLLLNKLGITQKWLNQGLEHVVLFQDTNALAFRALPALLGVSLMNDFTMNSLVVPRKPMEAVGAICKFSYPDGSTTTVNVEYNILDTLLRSTGKSEAEDIDEDGNSKFPGNSNLLVLKLSRYSEILAKTGGIVPEFVNPKFKNAEKKGSFKSPTRVESMMQDIARLFGASDKIGCTLFERSNAFSPLKNNVADASIKSKSGLAPESAFSGAYIFFQNTLF